MNKVNTLLRDGPDPIRYPAPALNVQKSEQRWAGAAVGREREARTVIPRVGRGIRVPGAVRVHSTTAVVSYTGYISSRRRTFYFPGELHYQYAIFGASHPTFSIIHPCTWYVSHLLFAVCTYLFAAWTNLSGRYVRIMIPYEYTFPFEAHLLLTTHLRC